MKVQTGLHLLLKQTWSIIFVVLSIPISTLAQESSAQLPSISLADNTKLLFNSSLVDGAPAFPIGGGYWLLLSRSGVIKYNTSTSAIEFIRLPKPIVSSWAVLNNGKHLVATAHSGVFLYDPKGPTYEPSYRTNKKSGQFIENGLRLTQISGSTGEVWANATSGLYRYRGEGWENLSPDVKQLGTGDVSSLSSVFQDEDLVWFNPSANIHCKGGLISFNTKTQKWKLFRKELLGADKEPERIDHIELISSPRYVWGFLYLENGFNFYLAVYDKKKDSWKSYHRAEIVTAIALLAKELPNCRWGDYYGWYHLRPILGTLERLFKYTPDSKHPYRFSDRELKDIRTAITSLKEVFNKVDPIGSTTRGMYQYSVQKGWIVEGRPYSENKPIHKVMFPQFSYTELLTSFNNKALIQTDSGFSILDVNKLSIRVFKPSLSLENAANIGWSWVKPEKLLSLCEYTWGMDSPTETRITLFDVENASVLSSTTTINGPDCSTYDTSPKLESMPIKSINLQSAGTIHLEWDGLSIERDSRNKN